MKNTRGQNFVLGCRTYIESLATLRILLKNPMLRSELKKNAKQNFSVDSHNTAFKNHTGCVMWQYVRQIISSNLHLSLGSRHAFPFTIRQGDRVKFYRFSSKLQN